MRCNAAYLGHR